MATTTATLELTVCAICREALPAERFGRGDLRRCLECKRGEQALLARRAQLTPAEQMRVSLARQRAAGVSFDVAWRGGFRNIAWPHERVARAAWIAVLTDDAHIAVWRCAFERRSHPALERGRLGPAREALDAAEVLTAKLTHHGMPRGVTITS